jgi:hypothetical protein
LGGGWKAFAAYGGQGVEFGADVLELGRVQDSPALDPQDRELVDQFACGDLNEEREWLG